ncbi:MAG: diguanylate cyclase [Candidatus Latescibacteria bacterium]|nr:diguanylate cyclase [Candidatus Latescibacterota bacterium]
MRVKPLNKIRDSFSAKVTLLVAASVMATSFVVGLATTHSTGNFLAEQLTEQLPSTLTTTAARLRKWHDRQLSELSRLAEAGALRDNVDRYARADNPATAVAAREELTQYLRLVRRNYPSYGELLVLDSSGRTVASAGGSVANASGSAAEAWLELGESGFETGASRPIASERGVHQWVFVATRDSTVARLKQTWLAARVDLTQCGELLDDVKLGPGGDLFILDAQGRFLTQPRKATTQKVGTEAMRVPTRQDGPIIVERRDTYGNRSAFHSKVHLDEPGWWLVYEEDYVAAMSPVIEAQRRIWVAVLAVGAIAILLALRIAQSFLKPIKDLQQGAKRINEGLVGVKIPKRFDDEVGVMIDTFNEMASRITLWQAELQYKNKILNTQNDRLQEMNERLEKLSVTDGLTGLFNHRHFWNLMNTELTRVNLHRGHLALTILDLDDFKRINDKFGHAVGDLLLQTVATVLKDTVRDTDIVARYGGEEFAILLPDTDEGGVQQVAEKIRAAIETIRFNVPETDITVKVTVSIGVSVFRGNRREFFNAADRALYKSKAAGKNCVHYALA